MNIGIMLLGVLLIVVGTVGVCVSLLGFVAVAGGFSVTKGFWVVLNRHKWYSKLLTARWPHGEYKYLGRWQIEQARAGTDTDSFYQYIGFAN